MKYLSFIMSSLFLCVLSAKAQTADQPSMQAQTTAVSKNAPKDVSVELDNLSKKIELLYTQVGARTVKVHASNVAWEELENFHTDLLQAMALDPTYGENNAKVSNGALERTDALKQKLKELIALKHVASANGAGAAFDKYVNFIDQILKEREQRHYSVARALVKKGLLEGLYNNLTSAMKKSLESNVEVSVALNPQDRAKLVTSVSAIRDTLGGLKADLEKNRQALVSHTEAVSTTQTKLDGYAQKLVWAQRVLWVALPLMCLTALLAGWLLGQKSSKSLQGKELSLKKNPVISTNKPVAVAPQQKVSVKTTSGGAAVTTTVSAPKIVPTSQSAIATETTMATATTVAKTALPTKTVVPATVHAAGLAQARAAQVQMRSTTSINNMASAPATAVQAPASQARTTTPTSLKLADNKVTQKPKNSKNISGIIERHLPEKHSEPSVKKTAELNEADPLAELFRSVL